MRVDTNFYCFTRDMPTAKYKIEFSKVLQSLCMAESKNKYDIFIYTFSRNLCFKSSFKNRFHKAFLVKSIPKTIQYMHFTL